MDEEVSAAKKLIFQMLESVEPKLNEMPPRNLVKMVQTTVDWNVKTS